MWDIEKSERTQLSYSLSLSATQKGDVSKTILKNASGSLASGDLLAIMGPSGGGKTSLLNCLTGRIKPTSGAIFLNGSPASTATLMHSSAFVKQEDLFIPVLTPREHLTFVAMLRMEQSDPRAAKIARVDVLLEELGLSKCADTMIGAAGHFKGISGGEKKRLAFASEIIRKPAVVLCDEPTSGLDSHLAEMIVSMMKQLAASGCIVVASIHQPSSAAFDYFTHLHLLSGGETVYFGTADGARHHFAALGRPVPLQHNAADHYLRLASGVSTPVAATADCELAVPSADVIIDKSLPQALVKAFQATVDASTTSYDSSCTGDVSDDVSTDGSSGSDNSRGSSSSSSSGSSRHGCFSQIAHVYKRATTVQFRDRVLTHLRLAQSIVLGLFVGITYFKQGITHDQEAVASVVGLLFFAIVNQCIMSALGVLQILPVELPIIMREHTSGLYHIGWYFLGRTLAEIPMQVFLPSTYFTIVYWMAGFPAEVATFFQFLLFGVLATNAAVSGGYFLSSISNSPAAAIALGGLFVMPWMFYGGLLIRLSDIPSYLSWISATSVIRYGFEGMAIVIVDSVYNVPCESTATVCMNPTSQSVLDSLDFKAQHKWRNVWLLAFFTVAYRCVAVCALVLRAKYTVKST